jgi:hypothetical protein
MSHLKKIIEGNFKIWENKTKDLRVKYRYVLYRGEDILAQFKLKKDAELFLNAKVEEEFAQLITEVKESAYDD